MRRALIAGLVAAALVVAWQYAIIRARVSEQAREIETMRQEVESIERRFQVLPEMIRVELLRSENRLRRWMAEMEARDDADDTEERER